MMTARQMPAPLTQKLRIKPGMRIMVLNPPPGYAGALGPLPEGVTTVSRPRAPVDLVQMFCRSMAELKDGLPRATEHLRRDGVFWICWPKQSAYAATDLNRDILWRVLLQAHFKPVASVAIDATWSALRFKRAVT